MISRFRHAATALGIATFASLLGLASTGGAASQEGPTSMLSSDSFT